jgi:hypothetical protein
MNKDLAGLSAIWRALSGYGGGASNRLLSTCRPFFKEPPKMVFAAEDGSVSGDGRSFRCCTVGELLQDCDSVSVIAVQEKCDEKGLGAASGHRNVRCRQFGRAPLRLSPSTSLGASAKQGRLSRKAREGAHTQQHHFP